MDPIAELQSQSKLQKVNELVESGDSDVQRFYTNSVVFITGGTGFLGKSILEKLLRACNIKKAYLLVRPKKKKTVQARLEELLKDSIFSTLHKDQPEFSSRLVCVEGDMAEVRLGFSQQDWKMLANEVEVIFHCAATTRFDEPLRSATYINVRGTREVLLLARAAERLKSFIHVSTAYSQTTTSRIGSQILEKFYPCPMTPGALVTIVEELDDGLLDQMTETLLQDWPNTYTFVKAVAEEQVRLMADGLPICIVRPSIVISSYEEPVPGWLDETCAYSASGMIVGMGLGIIHTLHLPLSTAISLVPVDYVTNACIAAGWEARTRQNNGARETEIYNVVAAAENLLTGDILQTSLLRVRDNFPSPKAVWKIFVLRTDYSNIFYMLNLILHLIPAYIGDAVCFLMGKNRRFLKIYEKVEKLMTALNYFFANSHIMDDSNLTSLYEKLSNNDRIIFNFNLKTLNWREFITIWGLGVRKYLVKDELKDQNKGKNRQFKYGVLNLIVFAVYFGLMWLVFIGLFKFVTIVLGVF